jgi:transposase
MEPTRTNAEWLAIVQQKDERIARQDKEIALLRQKLDLVIKRLFGAQSEKLDPGQLLLLLAGEEPGPGKPEEPVEAEAPRRSKVPSSPRERGPRLPEHLPVEETVVDPEPVKADPQAWRFIGEEVSEQLDYEPARFIRRRLIRRKYVPRHDVDGVPVIAPLPACLQERCIAAPGLLAQILVAKYCDHLPLYRQEQIYFSRHGVWLPRQSMARWVGLAADWLKPIYEQIRTGVMGGGYVQVDETPIEYLQPGHGRTRLGYLWAYSRPRSDVFFDWQTSRAASCLDDVIDADFNGTVQSDGYSAYPAFARNRGGAITLAGCWAHVRRKFHEALEQSPRTAGWFLCHIAHLYRVEAELRDRKAGPCLRAAERAGKSAAVQARIHRALIQLKLSRRHLPQSLMGRAIEYALAQWPTLGVWLEDGRIEIDNNLVENAIRPTAIGKKNWLFIGEAEAGERGAILYTIIESCRRRGIDPHAYLHDVLTRLPKMTNWQIKDVTPEAWAKSKQCSRLQAAA